MGGSGGVPGGNGNRAGGGGMETERREASDRLGARTGSLEVMHVELMQ